MLGHIWRDIINIKYQKDFIIRGRCRMKEEDIFVSLLSHPLRKDHVINQLLVLIYEIFYILTPLEL